MRKQFVKGLLALLIAFVALLGTACGVDKEVDIVEGSSSIILTPAEEEEEPVVLPPQTVASPKGTGFEITLPGDWVAVDNGLAYVSLNMMSGNGKESFVLQEEDSPAWDDLEAYTDLLVAGIEPTVTVTDPGVNAIVTVGDGIEAIQRTVTVNGQGVDNIYFISVFNNNDTTTAVMFVTLPEYTDEAFPIFSSALTTIKIPTLTEEDQE